jgi:RND family efflux transporter MFP subunit
MKSLRNKLFGTKKRKIITGIILILIILIVSRVLGSGGKEVEEAPVARKASVARVYDAINADIPLPVVGQVESQSEAVLRTESQGQVIAVYKKLGDPVSAGTVIAELSNASQRAEVLRNQGVLDAAKANLSRVEGNSMESFSLIVSSVTIAYTNADDAVRNKVDQFIEDPDSRYPKVIVSGDYNERQLVNEARYEIGNILENWAVSVDELSGVTSVEVIQKKLDEAQESLEKVRVFLNTVAIAVSGFEENGGVSQASINKYRSDVSTARTNINSTLSSLLSSSNSLRSQLSLDSKGSDILSAEASVTQARAGLLSANASLEKTIIRSPINGQINALTIQVGDFASSFEEVSQVVGSGELEVIAFINETDRESINIGATVLIEDKWGGKIVRIAPAINYQTQKIEIRISVAEGSDLKNGESVSLTINRTVENSNKEKKITVPISALKITSDGYFVLIVTEGNILGSTRVEVGDILGERIVIEDGLPLEKIIVLDARGFDVGDEITY